MRLKDFALARDRLLSAEKGRITRKPPAFQVALGFPNTYEVGISNLGFQTIYRLLNQMDQVSCERFFLFDFPSHRGTRTLESDRSIRDFDVIAFSIPFELDYVNVLRLLKLSNVPLLSSQRESNTPLVIAGGIAPTLNPEVLAPFLDLVFIGEAEEMVAEFVGEYRRLSSPKISKEKLLMELSKIEGVYVPRFYQTSYQQNGTIEDVSLERGVPPVIRKRSVNLEEVETYSPVISPFAHFANSLLIEVGRGCARGCRFCAAGHIYQPCRFYRKESVLFQVEKYAGESRHVGLVGSLISDHPDLEEICAALTSLGFEIGTSSLRVDMISPRLLRILVESGLRTLTVAPEVGTERMWKVIRKNIDREAVLKSARLASEAGIPRLKLYFIVGLPFEEEEDINGIVDLVRQVHAVFIKGHPSQRAKKRGARKLRISVNPFIPKPHTPFQWRGMETERELKRKLSMIADGLRDLKGVYMEKKSTRQAVLQGTFSLGNRKVGEGLFYVVEENLSFRQAWKKAGVDSDSIVFQPKRLNSQFPWDIVDCGVTKDRLRREFQKAASDARE